jgi:hypothetical protein
MSFTVRDRLNAGLVAQILFRGHAICEECKRLFGLRYASSIPEQMLNVISGASQVLCRNLERFRTGSVSEKDLRDIRYIDALLREIPSHLQFVVGAQARNLPWSLVQPLEVLASQLIPGHTVLLWPKWEWNYEVTPEDFGESYRKMLSKALGLGTKREVEEILAEFPIAVHLVAIPSVDRLSILQHTLLGHEVGHLFFAFSITSIVDMERIQADLTAKVKALVKSDSGIPELFKENTLNEDKLPRVFKVWERGFVELVSDVVCVLLFGPAAMLSYLHLFQGHDLDRLPSSENSFYPPARMRLRFVLLALEKTGLLIPPDEVVRCDTDPSMRPLLDGLADHLEHVKKETSEDRDLKNLAKDPYIKLAYDSVESCLMEHMDVLTAKTAAHRSSPKEFWRRMGYLVNRISLRVPPNSDDTTIDDPRPVPLDQILNAGWLYRITKIDPTLADVTSSDNEWQKEIEILNRLILRAIELSYVHEHYGIRGDAANDCVI